MPAALGRTIQPADDNRGAPGVIVLSDSLWRRHFGADPDALGKTVRIEGDIFEIVGVAPSEFIGITFPFAYQAWVAWNSPISAPDSGEMVGRTRAGVELASVKADLSRIAAQIPDTQPFAQPGSFSTVRVYPARVMPPEILGQISVVAGILSTLSGVVLFALAVNIGTLMSARLTERRGEMAIRQSLGASRRRLCRQIVTEGLVVSVVASAGAAFLGYVATTALLRAPLPVSLPPAGGLDPGYDWRVMVFTLGLCLAVTLVFALLPALQLPSLRSATSLAADTMAGPSRSLRRAAFISLQLGLATLLIATAMTTIRGTVNFLSMDSGFETQGVWTARLNATRQGHTPGIRGLAARRVAGGSRERAAHCGGEPSPADSAVIRLGGASRPRIQILGPDGSGGYRRRRAKQHPRLPQRRVIRAFSNTRHRSASRAGL